MKKRYFVAFFLLASFGISAQKDVKVGISTHFGTFSLGKTTTISSQDGSYSYQLSRGKNVRQSIYFEKKISPKINFSIAIGMHIANYSLDFGINYSNQKNNTTLKALEYGINLPIKAHFTINTKWPIFSIGIIPSYNLKTISRRSTNSSSIVECLIDYEKESRLQLLYTSALQYRLKTGTTFGVEYTVAARENTLHNFQQIFSEVSNVTSKFSKRYPLYLRSIGIFVAQELRYFP
jgi:hypothetical protein